jgi:hypothetical protein
MPLKVIYTNINKKAFWLCLSVSTILLIASFALPPTGSIDPSVMGGVGELFAFASLGTVIEAIDKGRKVTLNHGQTNVSIDDE